MEMEAAVNNADERVSGINDDLAKTLKVAVRLQNINCLYSLLCKFFNIFNFRRAHLQSTKYGCFQTL